MHALERPNTVVGRIETGMQLLLLTIDELGSCRGIVAAAELQQVPETMPIMAQPDWGYSAASSGVRSWEG